MDRIAQWSELYGIEQETVKAMHSAGSCLDTFYSNQLLLHQVFKRNSELVLEFCASLPEPSRHSDHLGISIEFLFPTQTAYKVLFESDFGPKAAFKEMNDKIATLFLDAEGNDFYNGPLNTVEEIKIPLLPTFVETVGFWEKGFQNGINMMMPQLIESKYFVSGMTIGNRYDERQNKIILDDDEVGVGKPVIWYICSSRLYDPSSGIGETNLEYFWDEKSRNAIKAKIKKLNSTFFEKEKQKNIIPSRIFDYLLKKRRKKRR